MITPLFGNKSIGFGSSRKRNMTAKLSEAANGIIEKQEHYKYAHNQATDCLRSSMLSEAGNGILSKKKAKSKLAQGLDVKKNVKNLLLKESLYIIFEESNILDSDFKKSYGKNLRQMLESSLGVLYESEQSIFNEMNKTVLLEEMNELIDEYADKAVSEGIAPKKVLYNKTNMTLEDRLNERRPVNPLDSISDIDEDLIIGDEQDDLFDSPVPVKSSLEINKRAKSTVQAQKKDETLDSIFKEAEPDDDRLISEKDQSLCSDKVLSQFTEQFKFLLEQYNTVNTIKQKVIKVVQNEIEVAKKEKELFDSISDKTGITVKPKSTFSGTSSDMDTSMGQTMNDDNAMSTDMGNSQSNLPPDNDADSGLSDLSTSTTTGVANSENTAKDGKVETNVSSGAFSLTESADKFKFMGNLNSKISTPSIFKTINVGLVKANNGLLQESPEIMDNIFAETISFYTLLEELNTLKLFSFKNESHIRQTVQKLSSIF